MNIFGKIKDNFSSHSNQNCEKKSRVFFSKHRRLFIGLSVACILAIIISVMAPNIQITRSPNSGKITIKTGLEVVDAAGTTDYQFTGVSDNTVFNTAISAMIASQPTGGQIYVSGPASGYSTINFTATVNVPTNVTITGCGNAASFVNNGSTPIFTVTGNGTSFQNIKLDAGGISTGSYTYTFNDVMIGTTVYNSSSPTVYGATGRGATITVATSTSTASEKAQADYVLTGTADQTIINSAISAANGGEVVIDSGTVRTSATITMASNVTLELNGTVIRPQGNFACITATNINYWRITGGGWIINYADVGTPTTNASAIGIYVNGSSNAQGWVVENGFIEYCYNGLYCNGTSCWHYSVENVYVQLTADSGYYLNGGEGGSTAANFISCEATQTGSDLTSNGAFYATAIKGLTINGCGFQTVASAGGGSGISLNYCIAVIDGTDVEACYPATNNGAYNFSSSSVTMNSCYTYANNITIVNSYLIYMYGSSLVCNELQTNSDVGTNSNNAFIMMDSTSRAIFNGGSFSPPSNSVWWLSYGAGITTSLLTTGIPTQLGVGETSQLSFQATGGSLSTIMTGGSIANPYGVAVEIVNIDVHVTTLSSAATSTIDVGTCTTATGDPNVVKTQTAMAIGVGTVPIFNNSSTPIIWGSANYVNAYTTATAASTNAVIDIVITVRGI